MLGNTCGICPQPSVIEKEDCLGHVHRACAEHRRYMDGWLRDVEHEVRSENAAAARYEREYE